MTCLHQQRLSCMLAQSVLCTVHAMNCKEGVPNRKPHNLPILLHLHLYCLGPRNALKTSDLVQGVPTNKLHEQGYVSIGCEPCTRPVLPNQHEREGRWWWEVSTLPLSSCIFHFFLSLEWQSLFSLNPTLH